MEDGTECGKAYESNKAFLIYMKRTEDNVHAYEVFSNKFVLTNCCPICLSTFASVHTARLRVTTTLKTNRCVLDGGMINETIDEYDAFICPRHGSEFEAASWKHLCMHITTEHFGILDQIDHELVLAYQTSERSLKEALRRGGFAAAENTASASLL